MHHKHKGALAVSVFWQGQDTESANKKTHQGLANKNIIPRQWLPNSPFDLKAKRCQRQVRRRG